MRVTDGQSTDPRDMAWGLIEGTFLRTVARLKRDQKGTKEERIELKKTSDFYPDQGLGYSVFTYVLEARVSLICAGGYQGVSFT